LALCAGLLDGGSAKTSETLLNPSAIGYWHFTQPGAEKGWPVVMLFVLWKMVIQWTDGRRRTTGAAPATDQGAHWLEVVS